MIHITAFPAALNTKTAFRNIFSWLLRLPHGPRFRTDAWNLQNSTWHTAAWVFMPSHLSVVTAMRFFSCGNLKNSKGLLPPNFVITFYLFWLAADFRRDLLICKIRITFHCLKDSSWQNQSLLSSFLPSFCSSLLFRLLLLYLDIFLVTVLCNQHVLNLASFPFQIIRQDSTVNIEWLILFSL